MAIRVLWQVTPCGFVFTSFVFMSYAFTNIHGDRPIHTSHTIRHGADTNHHRKSDSPDMLRLGTCSGMALSGPRVITVSLAPTPRRLSPVSNFTLCPVSLRFVLILSVHTPSSLKWYLHFGFSGPKFCRYFSRCHISSIMQRASHPP